MDNFDQATRASQRRHAAPETENAPARRQIEARSADRGAPTPACANRRQVLARGAGVLGVLAGGVLLGRSEQAAAATAPADASVTTMPSSRQKHLGLQITVAPLQTRHAVWVDHEWDFGAHFTGATPPVVVATALDDHMEHDPSAFCACAVAVRGTPGAYRAMIMVRNISKRATTVVINAVAVGE